MDVGRSAFGAVVLLVAMLLLLHAPAIGRYEPRQEEGRRALATRDLVAGGDLAVPSIFGRPYLAKPPGFYWFAGAIAVATGDAPVDVGTVRRAALLASAAMLIAVFLAARRYGTTAACFTAWGVLAAPEFAAKAALGELDTLFSVAVFAATWLLLRAIARGSGALAVAAGLACGAAALVKGPVAHGFVLLPALVIAAADRGARARALRVFALAAPVAAIAPLAWWLVVESRLADEAALETFRKELGRGGSGGFSTYVRDRGAFVGAVVLGWMPVTLLVGLGLARRESRRVLVDEESVRHVLFALATGLALLFVWPAVRARYALPLLPLAALASAPVWAAVLTGVGSHAGAGARALRALGILAFVAAAAGPMLVAASWAAEAFGRRPPLVLTPHSTFALAVAALGGVVLYFARAPRAQGAAAMVVLTAWSLAPVDHGRERDAARHARAEGARLIEAAAGAVESVAIDHFGVFNLLHEVRVPLVWTRDPASLPEGSVLLRAERDGSPGDGWDAVQGWGRDDVARSPELGTLALWRRVR